MTVKDSVIYVGDNWTAADNFVSATDRDGKSLALEQLLVGGSVDTKKTGTYQVTYSIVTDEAATPNFFARLFGTRSQEAVTATATIKVVEKAEEQEGRLTNKPKRPQRTNGCYQRLVQPSLKAIRLQE